MESEIEDWDIWRVPFSFRGTDDPELWGIEKEIAEEIFRLREEVERLKAAMFLREALKDSKGYIRRALWSKDLGNRKGSRKRLEEWIDKNIDILKLDRSSITYVSEYKMRPEQGYAVEYLVTQVGVKSFLDEDELNKVLEEDNTSIKGE